MSEKRILAIRESIAVAKRLESQNHNLRNFLLNRQSDLHHSIAMPTADREQALFEFVIGYIELAPDILSALKTISRKAGMESTTNMFSRLAEDYFASPLKDLRHHKGLMELVNESYFTHRLIEELNDRLTIDYGSPIIPRDLTTSSLIVHNIIGEETANIIDIAITYLIKSAFKHHLTMDAHNQKNYAENHKNLDWDRNQKLWPFLNERPPIPIEFEFESFKLAL